MNIVKMIAPPKMPTREQIQAGMERRFGKVNGPMRSLIATCAEQAEKVLNEYWLAKTTKDPKEEAVIPPQVAEAIIHIKSNGMDSRHRCPNCGNRNIKGRHKYCFCCGSKIEWVSIRNTIRQYNVHYKQAV